MFKDAFLFSVCNTFVFFFGVGGLSSSTLFSYYSVPSLCLTFWKCLATVFRSVIQTYHVKTEDFHVYVFSPETSPIETLYGGQFAVSDLAASH